MNLSGNYQYAHSKELLWGMLMDPDILAKVTPGISVLELVGENQFKSIANVKIGPVQGSFKGKLSLEQIDEPNAFQMHVKQDSKIGNVQAKVDISLAQIDDQTTELQFEGKAQLSGLIARTGQRVLSGVARTLSKQFFQALEQELENQSNKK